MSPRAGLDREAVVLEAVRIVNSEGQEALTLGRLARDLGIQTPSLYNHIDGIAGLKREFALLNAHLLADRLSSAAMGKSGPEGVRAVADAFRTYIKDNPGLYTASLGVSRSLGSSNPELGEAEGRVVAIVLAVIASFGLQGEQALHAVRGLRSVVHGFTTLETAGGFGLPLDLDESFRRLIDMLIQGLAVKVGG